MKLITKLLALTLLLGLQSCTHYAWVSDSKSHSMLEEDLNNCQLWAFKQFPPNVSHRTKTGVAPVTSRTVRPSQYGGTTVTEAFVPIQEAELVDSNITPREIALKKCMSDNSWKFEAVK